jgi:hypothetical protein
VEKNGEEERRATDAILTIRFRIQLFWLETEGKAASWATREKERETEEE